MVTALSPFHYSFMFMTLLDVMDGWMGCMGWMRGLVDGHGLVTFHHPFIFMTCMALSPFHYCFLFMTLSDVMDGWMDGWVHGLVTFHYHHTQNTIHCPVYIVHPTQDSVQSTLYSAWYERQVDGWSRPCHLSTIL